MKKYSTAFIFMGLLAFAVYGGTLNYPFVFDDHNVVVENPALRYLSNIPRFFTTMGPGGEDDLSGLYRPLVFSSFTVNYILSGLDTFSYHFFDIVLHAINSFLLFLLISALQKATRQENRTAALLFSALFCVHPALTQSVIYISARSVLLMTFFCLGSLLAYVKYRTTGKGGLFVLSAFLFVCALFTKESAPQFIGVIFLMEFFFNREHGRTLKQSLVSITPFAAAAVIFVAVRLNIISGADETLVSGSYTAHWLAEISTLPRYVLLVASPFGLCVEHFIPDAGIGDGYFWAGLLFIGCGLLVFARYMKLDRLLACLIAWPFLALLPEMVLPLPERMVEYRLYLPMAGLTVFLATAFTKWTSTTAKAAARYAVIAILCILVASGVLAFQKGRVWASPRTIWVNAISRYPDVIARPYNNLGQILAKSGEYNEAISLFTKAIRVNPGYYIAYNNLGMAYGMTGNYALAKEVLVEAIRINPGNDRAYDNLGNIYSGEGNLKDAISMYRMALELNRYNYKAYYNLGSAYIDIGAFQDAFETFREMSVYCPENGQSKVKGAELLKIHGQIDLARRLLEMP